MTAAKTPKKDADGGVSALRTAIREGTLANFYIFTGEESYLRHYYLAEVRKALVSESFAAFNYHKLDSKDISFIALREMAEAMPMLDEHTLLLMEDFDPFALKEEQREEWIALLSDWPEHCCLILHYDLSEYKPNRTMKRLCEAMQRFTVVDFRLQEADKLTGWVRRHCRENGKDIDHSACEYLIFCCGSQMASLLPEIDKLCAYAKKDSITAEDIRTVVTPVTEAVVFELTNAITAGKKEEAAAKLGELLRQQESPIHILAALGAELRRLYTARLALDGGRDKLWLMELWNMRSDYPARLLMAAAGRVSREWCRHALTEAETLDRRMKTENGMDDEEELKRFLMELLRGERG